MKKQILFLCAAAMLLVSCIDRTKKTGDGEEVQEPAPTEAVAVSTEAATVIYKVVGHDDDLLLFEFTAIYTDASGKEVSESVTAFPWTKRIAGVKLPFEASLDIKYVAKKDFPEKTSYKLGFDTLIDYLTSTKKVEAEINTSTMTIGRDKVEAYQKMIVEKQTKKKTQKIE